MKKINKGIIDRIENSGKIKLKTVILLLAFLSIGYLILVVSLYAAVPQRINYQGKLLDNLGAPVTDGSRNITFRIFNVSVGGAALWSETQSVNTQDGLFNVILGSVSAISLDFNQDYWLEIEVSGDGAMTPRHRLVSVPYSFRAENANNSDELNYQSASYYLNASNINAGTLSDSRLSANVTRLGSTIEYTEISNNIVSSIDGVTNDGGNIDLVAGTNMTITPNDIANTITFDASTSGDNLGNHTATQNINLNGHYLSGDGENEGIYVPNNGKVGINTNSPVYNLDVVGDGFWAMAVRSGVTNFYEAVIIEDSGWQPDLTVEGSMKVSKDTFLATDSGNVGIGTTSPIYPLHMGSGAYCSAVGAWTNASSRKYKENIEELTKEKAISVLKQLKPVEFNYKIDKEDKYVGFISEDVPELVATKDRKGLCSMDIVGVLTKVVQEQQTINEGLLQRISELEKEIKQLKKQK